MKINLCILVVSLFFLVISCGKSPKKVKKVAPLEKGSFGYDLQFLKSKDSVIVLKNGDSQVIISPKYQGKVFTSTAMGLNGSSSGWIN